MSNVNAARMTEQEGRDLEWEKFMEYLRSYVTVVKEMPFHIDDNCPFLVKKLEDAYKVLEEAPLPEYLVKWQKGED